MKTDTELEKAISEEIRMDSRLSGCTISVHVENGIAFLTGSVRTISQKTDAELAAKRIHDLAGINNQIEIKTESEVCDEEIRKTVFNAVIWNSTLDKNRITVMVKKGWV